MNILILGGSGLVGGNFIRILKQNKNHRWLATHYTYETPDTFFFDTLDPECHQDQRISSFKPDVVIHTGALTHVDLCEKEPDKSYALTVNSTKNALNIARRNNASFVYISTDYVFDGKSGPYMESDKVQPVSVYGKHKLEAEQLVENSGIDSIIIRITNVYGDELRGKNFVSRIVDMAKKRESKKLTLPYDQYASPVNAYDVARATMQLIDNNIFGLFHISSTDYMNRVQLAQTVLSFYPENKLEILPIDTKTLAQAAPRPLQGGLKSAKFLKQFPDFKFGNLCQYLNLLVQTEK
jgi:dTDP-4-dehydrorhamnose reductase